MQSILKKSQAASSDEPGKNKISVRLARTPEEIKAAQHVRYLVFLEEYATTFTEKMNAEERDYDRYDEFADHMIVVDSSGGEEKIIGTYRLLRRDIADQNGGFYSSGEYDLSPILANTKKPLELGRSCVLTEYRTRPVLQLLWQGISSYVIENNIELLFGCGSLHGTDISKLSTSLSYLHHYHLAPEKIRARAVESRYVDMNLIPKDSIKPKAAFNDLPPLIKGYLRIGATIGDGAVIDHQFNTTDVLIVMPTDFVTKRYREHFERKNDKPLPASNEFQELLNSREGSDA